MNRSPGWIVRLSVETRRISASTPVKLQIQHGGGFGKTHHRRAHAHASSACFATATSEKGELLAGDFLVILVALAGDQHHIP